MSSDDGSTANDLGRTRMASLSLFEPGYLIVFGYYMCCFDLFDRDGDVMGFIYPDGIFKNGN